MTSGKYRKVAFVSSFLPRRCGIAVFCNDLITGISNHARPDFEPVVVAMVNDQYQHYSQPVMFEIRKTAKNDYLCAADYLNFGHVDLVSVQHEFGLFGGDGGSYLNRLLERVHAPVITTLHTVLEKPNEAFRQSLTELCSLSDTVIVMNRRGIGMLTDIYNVIPDKIVLVPHGMPDLPFVDSSYYKHKFRIEGRRTILTFGLLSRNKGIEDMLKAMPAIVQADPTILYIILGATHPEIMRQSGEEYRFELQRLVEELNLQSHVMFYNQFVSDEKLSHFLCAADIYVTPYKAAEQLTSGTLAFAVAAGKAVVSTPYWAAEDLLANDRGRLVPFNDPTALADAIISILKDEQVFARLRRRAYDSARTMIWPQIAKEYWSIFSRKPSQIVEFKPGLAKDSLLLPEIPEPSLEHLRRISDDTGLLQHASFTLVNRSHGYCTDDNARGVVAMTCYYAQYPDSDALRLLHTYLSFICHAQQPDGTFYNFMTYDRRWLRQEPDHDGLCRVLWALGTVIARPPQPEMIPVLKELFDRSVSHVNQLSPRSRAYAIFGMRQYLKQFPGASDIKRCLHTAAEFLLHLLDNARDDWMWFEDLLCYDNAALPHALFDAFLVTQHKPYLEAAVKTCDFLLKHTYCNDHFSFIGCNGWFCKGQSPARFDQQPLDAMETVRMLKTAYEATANPFYKKLQRKAFNWFLGENDLSMPVYDFRTRGCCDGLTQHGVNLNQGAESTLSFILALLTILEGHSTPLRPIDGNYEIKTIDTPSSLPRNVRL